MSEEELLGGTFVCIEGKGGRGGEGRSGPGLVERNGREWERGEEEEICTLGPKGQAVWPSSVPVGIGTNNFDDGGKKGGNGNENIAKLWPKDEDKVMN